MNSTVNPIEFSIVVTLRDDRGHLAECISSWTQRQTFDRNRFEVIALSSQGESQAAKNLASLLNAADRVVQYDTDNELLLYDVGARQARGRWLLFTEAHCAAESDCLERLAAFLENHKEPLVGACLRTGTDGSRHPIALAEERWYREGFEQWSREGDWRKVTIRGTAIRRDIYQAIGGFRSEFGCFAESLLAADLHAAGYRLGYAELAAIKHYNSTDVEDFLSYVREYRNGELAYQLSNENEAAHNYFDLPGQWLDANLADQRLALRCVGKSLARATCRLHKPSTIPSILSMPETLLRLARDAVLGRRYELLKAFAGYARARAQFSTRSVSQDEFYRRFCRLLDATGRLVRARALLRSQVRREHVYARAPSPVHYETASLPSGCLVDFHATEDFAGLSFRWSSPLALVRIELEAGDYEVSIDTGGIGGFRPRRVDLYLNGNLLRPLAGGLDYKLRFSARRCDCSESGYQTIVLICDRVSVRGTQEHRALGIPVVSISFVPALSAQPDHENSAGLPDYEVSG